MFKEVDLTDRKISRVICGLAFPMMLSLFFQNLYAFVDTLFVSWLGSVPLAAVSMAVPLTYLALSLGKGVALGSVVLMSFARGNQDEAGAKRIATAALPLILLVMTVFLPLLVPQVCRTFFRLLGADGAVTAQGIGFTFWLVAGFPVMGYVMIVEAWFTSRGDTVTPMKAMILGNLLNVALEPIFIFGLGWGVVGASLATFISQVVAAVYITGRLRKTGTWPFSLGNHLQMLGEWRRITKQGAFVALAFLVSPVGLIWLNLILARFGATAIGAWNLMARTEMMIMLPVMGISNALAVFISYNLGRNDRQRIRQGLVFFFKLVLGIIVPAMLGLIIFPSALAVIFRPAPELLALSSAAIRAAGVAGLFAPLLYGLYGMSQGFKKPGYMLAISFSYLICLRLPLAYLFSGFHGVSGVFWSYPFAAAGAAMLAGVLIIKLWRESRQSSRDSLQPSHSRVV